MNTDTGRLYVSEDEITAAESRGEKLAYFSPETTLAEVAVTLNRAQRRAARFGHKPKRDRRIKL